MNAEHFPPLSSRCNITKVAFGLPKHSQPRDEVMEKRLQCQHLPPIASPDPSSTVVGNLPLNFTWNSARDDKRYVRDIDQIMMELQPPETRLSEIHGMNRGIVEQGSGRSLNPPLTGKGSIERRGRKLMKEEKGKQLVGPACQGPSIEDLFSHSYSPPPVFSLNPSSRWVWVAVARV